MKVFVAGATGAIGKALVPQLVARGHDVTGLTRSPAKAGWIRGVGAEAVIADALDAEAIGRAVAETEPDAVVHELTSISETIDFRRIDEEFAATNRLRTEGTDILLAAARAAGATRFVAQSFAAWPYAREGGPVKRETDPVDPDGVVGIRETLEAILYLERTVTGAADIEGIALRYGGFYGPGTSLAPGTAQVEAVRKRKFPLVGDGGGVWSFVHIDDAAAATVAAVERGKRGVYNITDDDPAPVSTWLPALAVAAGAKPPRHVPAWLGRLFAGEAAVVAMTELRGASNEKAKRELGWTPRHPSWREGFVSALAAA
jgi:nucleoside-diphosphate-sugar epimerase